jgi:hypothetical protein
VISLGIKMGTNFNILEKVAFVYSNDFFNLLDEVWARIPEREQQIIFENLARIAEFDYRTYNNDQKQRLHITENTGLCVVSIDGSRSHGIIKVSIAHELAHVFYNHPKNQIEEAIADEEAKAKAKEWGFVQPS